MKSFIIILAAAIISGCASGPSIIYKMSDHDNTRIIEGMVKEAKATRTPTEVTLTDTVTTGVAANNVGNSSVVGAMLFLDVLLSDPTTWTWDMVIADEISNSDQIYHHAKMGTRRVPDVNNRVRIICKKENDCQVLNITKNQKLLQLSE